MTTGTSTVSVGELPSPFVDITNLPPKGMHNYLMPNGVDHVLTRDFPIETRYGEIIVPKGFITDLASIPSNLRSLIQVQGKHWPAAVLHDYFYRVPESRFLTLPVYPWGQITLDRELVDDMFLEEMRDLKVTWWKRKLMYRGVRVGGASSWREG